MSEKPTLGRLEKVDLRTHWEHEESQFTPWLAQEENLQLLGDTIEMELELQDQEASVGPFRADLVCRNLGDGSLVLIENQLERTDHTHLGQLITYAAGLDAVSVVWIARRFTEEHRAAVDWLNRISDDDFYFFGMEVELWRIGDSVPAPKFDLVAKPNEWTKTVQEGLRGTLTPAQQHNIKYWRSYCEFLEAKEARFNPSGGSKEYWKNWGMGRSGVGLNALLGTRDKWVGVSLYLEGPHAKAYFSQLYERKEQIVQQLPFSVSWEEKPDLKHSKISVREDADPSDEGCWPELHNWMLEKMTAFDDVFRPIVRDLDVSGWETASED